VALGKAGVPGSGQGGSRGVTWCRGLELAGVSRSTASLCEGRRWHQGCPLMGSPSRPEDPVAGGLSPRVELGVTLQPQGGEDGCLGQLSAISPVYQLGEAGALCRAGLLLQQVEEPLLPVCRMAQYTEPLITVQEQEFSKCSWLINSSQAVNGQPALLGPVVQVME